MCTASKALQPPETGIFLIFGLALSFLEQYLEQYLEGLSPILSTRDPAPITNQTTQQAA